LRFNGGVDPQLFCWRRPFLLHDDAVLSSTATLPKTALPLSATLQQPKGITLKLLKVDARKRLSKANEDGLQP
jgi:hypothetical protein